MGELEVFLRRVIATPPIHARWLNTLSYLENCGARLIARCEHPTMVPMEVLKHAAEEFRHAYFLKAQIQKVFPGGLRSYGLPELIGGYSVKHYLYRLNLLVSRFLKSLGLVGRTLKEYGYLLVTYAIEMRAKELYPLYQRLLKEQDEPISLLTIIREEEHHLNEIHGELKETPAIHWAPHALQIEQRLYRQWLQEIIDP